MSSLWYGRIDGRQIQIAILSKHMLKLPYSGEIRPFMAGELCVSCKVVYLRVYK